MSYTFDLTDELRDKLSKLKNKYPKRAEIVKKKIQEVIKYPLRYKNLRYDLKDYRRVHIDRHFVMVFSIDKNHVLFIDIEHHDKVY